MRCRSGCFAILKGRDEPAFKGSCGCAPSIASARSALMFTPTMQLSDLDGCRNIWGNVLLETTSNTHRAFRCSKISRLTENLTIETNRAPWRGSHNYHSG